MPTPPDNRAKAYWHFAAHCLNNLVTVKGHDKFTRHQNVERYRRLLKTATDEERRSSWSFDRRRAAEAKGRRRLRVPILIYEDAWTLGCEGIVSKRLGSPYR